MLTQSEIDAIVAEVAAGTYDSENALEDIAQKQKGEDVRKALYSLVYTLLQEGKAGSVDMVARNEIQNYLTAHSGQWGETVLWEGTAQVEDDTIELSEPCDNYDFIDVYSSISANVYTETGADFKYGFDVVNVSNLSSGTTPSLMVTHISAIADNPLGGEDGIHFHITSANEWKHYNGTASSRDATSQNPIGRIKKIVGRKLLDDAEVVDAREGYDGTVYNTVGEAIRTQIDEAMQGGGSGTGLTQDIKQALLQCFAHTAWTDDQGQTYYDDLEDALYPFDLLSTISAVYTQSGTVYNTDSLDSLKADLVVTGAYSDGTYNTIRNYTLSGTLTAGTSTITVTYGGKTATFTVTVTQSGATLASISANYTQSGTVYENTSLDSLKSDLVVTANWSDSTTTTVASTDYTLSGTLTVGTSTITVTYGGKTDTFNVTVSQAAATLTSISAAYTQSGTVYDTDTLDSLKTDLVVTAHYSDSTTATVPASDYTLSGTLAEGTSTITVSYGGKTATFNVTVTHYVAPLYQLDNGTHNFTAGNYNGYVTISDHKHIKFDRLTAPASSGGANYICLSDLDHNGTTVGQTSNINNHSSIFSVNSGDQIRFVVDNVSGSFDDYTIGLRKADGTTSVVAVSGQTTDSDTLVTVSATSGVGCLFMYIGTERAATKDFEADVAVYVNDVQYF